MRDQPYGGPSLFGHSSNRKYLNAAERRRFLGSTQQLPPPEHLFCQVLAWSGGRISEVLALTPAAIDIESGVASLTTLKRRRRGIVRQVPLPPDLLTNLDRLFGLGASQRDPELAGARLWAWSRTTAWRRVKDVMAMAGSSAHQPCQKVCGTVLALMLSNQMCRRISFSAGLATLHCGRLRSMEMSSGRMNGLSPHACGPSSCVARLIGADRSTDRLFSH